MSSEGKFRVGQMVRCVDDHGGSRYVTKGRCYIVEDFDQLDGWPGIRTDDGDFTFLISPRRFEPVTDDWTENFTPSAPAEEEGCACGWHTVSVCQTDCVLDPRSATGEVQPIDHDINPEPDAVNRPHHYARFVIEPISFINANRLPFNIGNVIKYACRYDAKNGVEDLRKAIRYLEMQIETIAREERVAAGEAASEVWKESL